jgi:hypothetical protein
MVLCTQGRESSVSLIYSRARLRLYPPVTISHADPSSTQTLALLHYPLDRQLLPHVGDYISIATSPPYRAETVGST